MAFPLNSNNLRILSDDSVYSIEAHFFQLAQCHKYLKLGITPPLNAFYT